MSGQRNKGALKSKSGSHRHKARNGVVNRRKWSLACITGRKKIINACNGSGLGSWAMVHVECEVSERWHYLPWQELGCVHRQMIEVACKKRQQELWETKLQSSECVICVTSQSPASHGCYWDEKEGSEANLQRHDTGQNESNQSETMPAKTGDGVDVEL